MRGLRVIHTWLEQWLINDCLTLQLTHVMLWKADNDWLVINELFYNFLKGICNVFVKSKKVLSYWSFMIQQPNCKLKAQWCNAMNIPLIDCMLDNSTVDQRKFIMCYTIRNSRLPIAVVTSKVIESASDYTSAFNISQEVNTYFALRNGNPLREIFGSWFAYVSL